MSKLTRTSNGYEPAELISAIQKSVRRSLERDAMWIAMELLPFYREWLWKRLIVIANEDIGLANPILLLIIPSLRDQFFMFWDERKFGSCRLILANAILLLCRSKKSRLADHFQCAINQDRLQNGTLLEIPDYALDMHTGRGKRKGRGLKHFLEEGCKLANPAEVHDPYEKVAAKLWQNKKTAPWEDKR